MRQRIFVIATIIIIMALAAVSNPQKSEYINFMKETTLEECDNNIERGLVSIVFPSIYDSVTKSKNYIFFSIYETKLDKQNLKVLGVFNNFIPFGNKKSLDLNTPTQGA